ncbi:snake venom vascular endothelial growth factor toxin HF [Neolamprologus brichardi]|uniref:snake venom vascular endothelial growth factor toxin HF n=1 Tax=Neolamprologus brichardi TaxID=32507 RepID=UPI0003EC3A0E|nr:snake venom vascular endothelial growth factor toxin HF [Neolamprologus brichardi]
MQTFLGILQLLLVLQRVPAQMSDEGGPNTVIQLSEVMAKCSCQVMDQLVYVYDEYPQSVENIYVPHCVVVRRCSGYCSGEEFKCLPTLERNATLQLKISSQEQPMVELTFLEHQQCQCRDPENLQYYERSVIKSQQQQQVH